MKSIETLRLEVDICDKEIIRNFEKRLELVLQISEIKNKQSLGIYDKKREEEIIRKNTGYLSNTYFTEDVQNLSKKMLDISKELQSRKLNDESLQVQEDVKRNNCNEINPKNNIILTGFMGTGKTTVGRKLSETLEMDYIDIDTEIEKNEGMSIQKIFDLYSEQYFRALEKKYISECIYLENTIISCGGGAVLDSDNREILKKSGLILLLEAENEVIVDRLKNDTSRPLIGNNMNAEFIQNLKHKRAGIYTQVMNMKIDTSYKSIEQITSEALMYIDRKIKTQDLFEYTEKTPSICISITSSDFVQLEYDLKKIKSLKPDIIEFRADFFLDSSYSNIVKAVQIINESLADIPMIFTLRSTLEGGKTSLDESQRISIIKQIIQNNHIDILDIEIMTLSSDLMAIIDECHSNKIFVIGSYHDFDKIPENEFLKDIFIKNIDLGCHAAKIAVKSNSVSETAHFLKDVMDIREKNNGFNSIPIAMGKEGMLSRVIFEARNPGITYTSIIHDKDKNSSIGQLDFNTLKMFIEMAK